MIVELPHFLNRDLSPSPNVERGNFCLVKGIDGHPEINPRTRVIKEYKSIPDYLEGGSVMNSAKALKEQQDVLANYFNPAFPDLVVKVIFW